MNDDKPGDNRSDQAGDDEKSVFASPLLITALTATSAIAAWGLFDTAGLADTAALLVRI